LYDLAVYKLAQDQGKIEGGNEYDPFNSQEEEDNFRKDMLEFMSLEDAADLKRQKTSDIVLNAIGYLSPTVSIKASQTKRVFDKIKYGENLESVLLASQVSLNAPTYRIYTLSQQITDALEKDMEPLERLGRATNILNRYQMNQKKKQISLDKEYDPFEE